VPGPVVEAAALVKRYGEHTVVDGVSFAVEPGECLGLLGPNGAGKTTTIRMVTCFSPPSGGSLRVFGLPVDPTHHRAIKARLGIVQQDESLDPDLTVEMNLVVFASYFGIPRASARARAEEMIRFAALAERRDARIRTLSGGMKRRVLIAKALAHEPQLLFLDEPTAGVDVELRKHMWQTVRELRESGVTIILTTHYIDEAEEMADRVGVINNGELILVEHKTELMRKLGKKQLTLQLQQRLEAVPPGLSAYNLHIGNEGSELTYTYDTQAERTGITSLLKELSDAGIRFRDLQTKQSSLEDIFVDLVKRPQ